MAQNRPELTIFEQKSSEIIENWPILTKTHLKSSNIDIKSTKIDKFQPNLIQFDRIQTELTNLTSNQQLVWNN